LIRKDGNDLLPQHVEAFFSFFLTEVWTPIANDPIVWGPSDFRNAKEAELFHQAAATIENIASKDKFLAHWEKVKAEKGWEIASPYEI